MPDTSFTDLIPFLFPSAYLLALVALHRLATLRPSQALLREMSALASSGKGETEQTGLGAWPVPSQSVVLAGWRALHERQVKLVLSLERDEVFIELETRLCELPVGECSEALRNRVERVLREGAEAPRAPHDEHLETARALLQRLRTLVFDARDTAYEDAASVYRKAVWLTVVGAAAIAALGAGVEKGELFFLVGAVGGLLGRLNRVLQREPRAYDYGASWSTLILAPIAGGLAGWFGVLLTEALASGFGVLDKDTFKGLFSNAEGLPADRAALALGVAFVFGFSERLINRAVAAAEEHVVPKLP